MAGTVLVHGDIETHEVQGGGRVIGADARFDSNPSAVLPIRQNLPPPSRPVKAMRQHIPLRA